jgi:chemotaxis family two-component system response regulator Rcp1
MSLATPEADSIELLLVEDREADIELTRQGLAEIGAPIKLHIARDGVEAIAFLRRESSHQSAPRPHLVLLDLNLPRMDGRELLAAIKGDAQLKLVPVVILTTSESDRDVAEAYAHHANAYMVKPVEFDRFVEVIRSIADYWFNAVKLPPRT